MAPAVDFSPRRRLIILVAFAAALLHKVSSASEASPVPALYVFGDSLADVGNNNNRLTLPLLRADYPHHGIDYPGRKATGRFSNGKLFQDFLAEHLNLASPPAYSSVSNSAAQYMKGVNFASAGAGVSSFEYMGLCASFDEQIQDYSRVHATLVNQLEYSQASRHLANSIFAINIGSTDILNYVRMPLAVVSRARNPTHKQLIDSLIRSLTRQLQMLYNLGARKLLFVGAGPIGCCPLLRLQSLTNDCDEEANNLSSHYNTAVTSLLKNMSSKHSDMRYSLFNTSAAMLPFIQQPEKHGFEEVRAACCGIGDLNAVVPCTPVSNYCANRTNHVFWDFAHPTEITVKRLSEIGLDGAAPFVYPINVRQLIALQSVSQ